MTKILIDALKPREMPIVELSKAICSINGVDQVDIVVTEVDQRTETTKITIAGNNIPYSQVAKVLEQQTIAIRGIDAVTTAKAKPLVA